MLEQLTAHMDAWAKAAKQQKRQQAPMGKPPARQQPRPPIERLPAPDTNSGSRLRPELQPRMRPGDLGPGIPIPMIPPTLPPAGPGPGRAGPPARIGPQPTVNTNPPALRVNPPPRTGQPNAPATTDGRATAPAPTAADLERLRQEAALLAGAGGKPDRGRANAQGTYPYDVQGHGPTEKYMAQTLRDQMLQLRSKAPNLFYRGTALRTRDFTPEEQRNAKWDDGTPITLEEMYLGGYMGKPTQEEQLKQQRLQRQMQEEQFRQQRLQMQQQNPQIYGYPGTTFRQPKGSATPGGGGGGGGPMTPSQRALEDVLRLRQQVPVTGPLPQQKAPTRRRTR